jgi:hypothetical protein
LLLKVLHLLCANRQLFCHLAVFTFTFQPVAYRGGFGVFKSPRNSEILTKSNRIGNWAENVWCSYSNILISLKIAEFRTPSPQDDQKEGSKILKLPVRNCFTLTMTNKLVVILNSLKYQKLKKFYFMKWNFFYQIAAAYRTTD